MNGLYVRAATSITDATSSPTTATSANMGRSPDDSWPAVPHALTTGVAPIIPAPIASSISGVRYHDGAYTVGAPVPMPTIARSIAAAAPNESALKNTQATIATSNTYA